MKSLTQEETKNGVICASAGNHAQGVAFACSQLGINGKIYMPATTPKAKSGSSEIVWKENVGNQSL